MGILFQKDIQEKLPSNCCSKLLCFGKMQTIDYHIGGISVWPNSAQLAPSTLQNKGPVRQFHYNTVLSFAGYGVGSKQSVVHSSFSCEGRGKPRNTSLVYGTWLKTSFFSKLLDPAAWAEVMKCLYGMSNSTRSRLVLAKSKFLNRLDFILFIF